MAARADKDKTDGKSRFENVSRIATSSICLFDGQDRMLISTNNTTSMIVCHGGVPEANDWDSCFFGLLLTFVMISVLRGLFHSMSAKR
jgi:type IV secretory pathway TrbD component